MNRFRLDEVEYINISYLIPYKAAIAYMEDLFEQSITNVR